MLAGLAAFAVSLLALVWVARVVLAQSGLEPAGQACSYEVDEGSGTAGYGTERLDWGLWPSRVCVTDTGDVFRGSAVDSTSPLQVDVLETENAPWWLGTFVLVLVVSIGVGGVVARSVHRRARRAVTDG